MDRKSKAIHPDKCSACLLLLPGDDLAQSIREQGSEPRPHRCTSGRGNLSSSETHQWGEGGMARESNGSCLEGSEEAGCAEGQRAAKSCWDSSGPHSHSREVVALGGRWAEEHNKAGILRAYPFFSDVKGTRERCSIIGNLEHEGAGLQSFSEEQGAGLLRCFRKLEDNEIKGKFILVKKKKVWNLCIKKYFKKSWKTHIMLKLWLSSFLTPKLTPFSCIFHGFLSTLYKEILSH